MSWFPSALISVGILAGAIILREVVLKSRRNDLLFAQERLDRNLAEVLRNNARNSDKLTIEENTDLLNQINKKSEAANVLGKISDAHWEVFELCENYLHRSQRELENIRAGSPRLRAINRGRDRVNALHKFHLLSWSAAESRTLLQEAGKATETEIKLEKANLALNILNSAIKFYPGETQLIESVNAVNEFITSVKVSQWIEDAEQAAYKGNRKEALNYYRDALYFLARENVRTHERDLLAEKINLEMEKLQTN